MACIVTLLLVDVESQPKVEGEDVTEELADDLPEFGDL